MELWQEKDLAKTDEKTLLSKVKEPLKWLGKHHYQTVYNENFSPTNAPLSAFVQSSTNFQIFDDYMVPRSVAKNAADVGSRAVVRIIAGEAENSVKILTEPWSTRKLLV